MPVFNDERILNLSVNQQEMPEPALGSPQQAELPRPPALPAVGGGIASDDKSRLGLSGDQLSKLANIPSLETGPNLIPIGEVVANKRYSTYARNMDLENIYGLQQAWYDQLANSAVKFAGTAVGTFAQSFASIPNTISAMKNGSLAELSGGPDGYEAAVDNWTKNLEDAFPNYFTRWERQHPFLSAISPSGAANFWGDKILKNLGFTAGAIAGAAVQDLAVGFVTEGVGAVPLIASQIGKASLWLNKILAGSNKIDKALDLGRMAGATTESIASAKKLGEIAEGVRLIDKFRYTTALYGASRTEAAVEARESYREIKEELIREHKRTTGEEPDGRNLDEIESYATDAMNTRFGINMALLTVSNAVQFGNVFKSFTSSAKKGAQQLTRTVDDVGEVGLKEGSLDVFEKVVPKTKTEKIWNAVRPKIDDIFSEGIYEEGGQFATQKGVTDYYTRKYKNKENWNAVSETVESTLTGLKDQFGTSEGLENMVIGALTATLTGGAKSYIDKKRGLTNDTRLNQVIGMLNSQGVTGILSNQYDSAVDAVGIAKDMEKAVEEGDIFRYKNLKSDMFFNLVTSRIPSGMHEVTIEQLKMLKDLDKDQFESLFGMDFSSSNKKTVSQYVDNLILKANDIKKSTDSLNNTFKNPFAFTKAPKSPDQELENKKYVKFENWKMDLANFSFRSKDIDNRKNSIQQSLFEINPQLSTSVLEKVTNVESLKELSKQYEEKAVQLQKSITESTPADIARDLRTQARNLRSLSEKINLELSNDEKNGKWFVDLLNFELNNQDEKAPPILGLENLQDIFTYGVDLNKLTFAKKQIAKSFEYLSSEKGFDEYIKDATIPKEEKEEEEVVPSAYEFVNKRGEKEPIEENREYQVPTFKKASVEKIDEDRYQVTDAEGNVSFYKSQEAADIAASESDEKYAGLEKVKVVALNADGSVKVEDANGDVYDIPISKLQGYEKVKTEQEKLEKIKDDVEQQQKELELSDSGTVAAVPFLDDSYKGNPEDFRKYWGWLFWSTTSASEDRDADSKKPHAQRSIAFLNNVKKFPNKGSMRVMLVTPKQEDALGLTGLHNLSMGEDIKRDASGNVIISDTNNALVAAVYVEQQGSEYYFVNKEGKRIGKVGDQVDLNQLVFSTMPDTSLFWNEGGKGAERYRVQEKKEAEEMSQRWALKRKELFNLASDKPEIYSFTVSNGIPVINDVKERNHVGGTLIDESRIKNQEGLIVVSTKGTLTHNGQSYKIGAGRAMIQYEDVFVPAVNHKFNKNQAESIYEVLRLLAANMQKQAANNQKIKFDPIYVKYLSNLLYWKKSEAAKGGANQMFIDSKMNLILGDKKYDITKLDQFKKEITDQLLEAYHTVNNKSLSSTEEAGINKFHERFVEFYVEEGQLKEREWTNYQTYLLSAKYPDGTARSANDTPVTTFVAKPTDLVPYNFKQKYAMLSETEFPALPVRPTAKTETPSPTAAPKGDVVKAGKYNVGTTEFVQNTYTEFKAIGPVSFEAKLKNEKETQVSIGTDKATLDEIDKIIGTYEEDGEETPVLKTIRQQLGAKYKSNDARFSVIFYMRQVIEAYLNKNLSEKQEAPKQEAPPVAPSAPKVAPIKIGDTEFIPDGTTLYTSTKVFMNEAPVQFSVSLSEAGKIKVKVDPNKQTGNHLVAISEKPESLAVIENTLRTLLKENYNENLTPEEKVAEFAAFKILSLLEEQQAAPQAAPTQAPVSDIEAKKADIERQVLGSFANTTERVVKSKGPSNGRTIRTELTSKISSDGEVIVFKSKNTFTDNGDSVISSPASMTIEEFKEHFYPMLNAEEIEMFEETLEVYKQEGWNGRIFFKELLVGSSKATNLKGQVNLDIMIGMGNDYGFTLTKKLTDAELAALEGAKPAATPTVEEDIIESTKEIQARLFEDLGVTSKIITDVYLGGNHYLETEDGKFYIINDINSGYMPELAKEVTREQIIKPFRTEEEWKKVGITFKRSQLIEETPAPPPVESAPKKKKGGKKHDDNGEYRLVETAPVKKEKISQGDIEMFKKWHAEVAPNLPYEISERIFMLNDGRRAYGMFVDGVAKFYRGAIRGTEYHEVFEGIWGAFLTSEEKQTILDELKAKSGTFTDRETGKKIRWDEATDKQIKERIADNFAEYRLGKLPARSLSEKIVRFFKNIIEFFKRIISKPLKVDQLFDDIDRGRFKNYVVPDSAKYAVPEYRAVEGLTEIDTRLYVEDMTSLIFQHMFGSNKSLYDIQKLTDKDLYDYVLQKYQESEKIDDTDADFLSTKQFNDLFTKTKEFLRQFKIEFEEGLVGDVNNNEADNRSYAPEPFSTDWKKHSGYPIKLLLGTLIRTKPSGKLDSNNISTSQPEWSELNGFQLLNFSKAFATVMDKLHNTSSVKRLIEKVVNLASLNSDYYRLLGRLKLNKAIKIVDGVISVDFSGFEAHDWRLFIQFYQTFTKQKPTALVQYISGDNVYTSPSNLFTAAEELKNDWLSDIKLLAKKKESLIYFNSDTKRYQVGDISKIPTTTPEQKIDFLNKLGITFPLSTYLRLSVKKEIGEKSEQEKFNDAVSSIQKYISKDKDIASITGDALKIDTPIKRLAELYVRVENPPHETTRPNIEGEMVNEYAENNHVSVFENEMNEATTLDVLREKRPELNDVFSESSVTLKKGGLFYDEDGNQIKKFKVNVIEGNKDIDGGKDTKVSRLSRGDAAVLQFNQNLKGDYYILVPADSSTEWMINLGNNISYDDVVNGRAWNKIYTIFRNYLNDEVKLAMSDRSYLKNTAPRAQDLRFFKELLPEEMVERIHKDIKDDKSLSEINKYIDENIEKVNSSVKSFIEDSSQDMLNDLMTFKRVVNNENTNFKFSTLDGDFAKAVDVDKNNLTKKELNDIMMFRNINYVINNIEMHKVIFGDPYQFKIKNGQLDETKRIKSYLSPRRTTVDFAELNTALNQNRNFAGDILLTENDLGHHEFSSSINTVTLSDVEVAGTIYANSGMTTETDGFSFMMDTTYRELKIKNGQWIDEKAEPWHQWQMAYTRNKLAKKGDYVYTNEKLKAQDEKMISKPAPKHMVEVLKTIVTGNKANKTYFDNILDKFSQMPVYYSMVEGTNLEKMYVKMWKEKIGYAVYESGRKVGAEALHSVYNKGGEFNNETFTGIVQVPWKALGVQVETTYEEFHDDLTRGSQTTKISTIDLFDNGVATSEDAELEYKRYITILNAYHENGTRELFDKLGLVHLGNGQFEIADPVALSESLKHELLRRDASDNVRYAIELDENKQFRVPFESSNAYIQIRDIIFSMVDKAVNSPKMHGGAYVQVPVTMFEKLGSSRSLTIKKEVEKGKFIYEKITKEEYVKLSDAEKKNVYLTDDTLKMPTKEDPYMEVMLPHWFREKLPKKFNTDEKILTYLNSTEDGRKLLRGIGFRIPTQALSSIAPIRVKGFLPQFAGHTVVVPSEITTMAGSDFDIDKMFIYLKSFYLDAAGDIRIVSLIDNSEGPTKEFYKNVYESTIQKEIDKIQRFDEFRDKAVDIFEKLEQFEEITLDNLEQLSEEDFEFYTTHAVLLNEMMEQAEEERLSPKEYILDQISKLDNKKDKLTQKMLNDDVKNKYIKKMYKRALENEYYDSLEKLITLPENYERNIAPVDDAGLKEVATELEKLTGDVGENVKNRLLSASYMTKLRHAFITAKRWVGIAAVNLTGHSNAQKTSLYLDTDRFANLSKSEKSILGDGRVALPHNTVKVGNREHVSMSGRLTADGKNIYISSRLSGYATTFVDVAKDPYIMKIIKSELAVGTFMFLERIGAGETIPFFMNQPIIRKYLEQLDESNFRSLFNGEQISYILSEFATTDSLLEETQLNVSLKSLKENIENYRDGKTDDAYNAMQQKIFMEFLKYAKMAEYSFKLTQASNYDTTRFRSGNSLFKKQTRTDVASDTNIFSSVDNVLDSTHLGQQAYYLDLAVEAVGEYLQLDKDGIRKNITDDILRPYAENTYLSDDKYEAIGLTVSTSLLDFIIQTKTGLNSEIANLTSESETSAVTLLMRAKEKFPNDDLLQLLEPRQARTGGPWTIKLKGNAKASGYDENYFIGRMREIRDNADPETQELTTKLYKALVKLSILQGSKQSAMSIKNIIPAEDYEKEVGDAVRNLKYTPEMDAFKLGMFYRNQWKNDDIFKKMSLNYRHASKNFSTIKELGITTFSRSVLILDEKYNMKNVSSDYLKMDRFIVDPYAETEDVEAVEDLLTGRRYTTRQYRTMLAKGETAPKEILGFEKVKYPDGSPLIQYDKDGNRKFVYKRINLYGDAGYVAEYYSEFKKSVLKNGTSPIEREADNNDLIRHFTSKEVVMPNQEPITGTDMVTFTPEETFQYPNKPEFNKLPSKSSTPTMTYAGIGSRETPPEILAQMTEVAKELESKGYRLNTGVTFGGKKEGADEAFYKGVGLLYNLFSPENQGSRSREQTIAKEIHPNPYALSPGAMKLMARNTNQVFGDNLDTPVDFVLFYAEEVSGSIRPKGGTGQAVEMARRKGIPTINMANPNWRDQFNNVLSSTEAPPFDITPTAPTAPKKESKTLTPTPEQQRIINKLKEKEVSVILANDGLVDILYKGEVYAEYVRTIDDGIRIGKALLQEKGVSIDENTDNYQYYGASYTIVLENGVGVDVVGYKGKNADKQKLLNAYNTNPNVDPQNGKPFRKETEQSKFEQLDTEEPNVSDETNTFTFSDGTVINTGNIKLNAQQENALQLAVNAIKRKQTKFVLRGFAGTGKSTISKFIREYIQQSKSFKSVVYSSPTHKANTNLLLQLIRGKIFNVLPSTIAVILNKKKENGVWITGPRNKMPSNGVLIVDESSMINNEDYMFLTNLANSKGSTIIFMGDSAQLPPVLSNQISKAMQFDSSDEGVELTQVMRQQGDNPLLDVLTNIRENLKSKTDKFSFVTKLNSKGEGISFTKNYENFNKTIKELFSSKEYKEDPTYAKILTYTNSSVSNYNNMIQNLLNLEPYSTNSIMMGYEQVGLNSFINNGQDYIILESEYVSNKPVKLFKGSIGDKKFDLTSEISGYQVKVRKVFSKEDEKLLIENAQIETMLPVDIFIINPIDDNNISFMQKALSLKQVLNDFTIPWSAKEVAMTTFEGFFSQHQFPADIINYKGVITTLQKLKEDNPKLFRKDPETGISEFEQTDLSQKTLLPKNIDYGYAVTSHKGQGSTYKYTFVDLENMDNPANLKIVKDKGEDFAIERQQLKYVGLSRASVQAFVYTRKTNEVTLEKGKEAAPVLKLPSYEIDVNLKNKDGSRKFGSTDGVGRIRINPPNDVQEFFDYFEGKEGGVTSLQKQKVLESLNASGWSIERIKSILNTVEQINNFLILHEQSHIDNNDKDVYWLNGKDLMTEDKVAIETRASIDALNKLSVDANQQFPSKSLNVQNIKCSK